MATTRIYTQAWYAVRPILTWRYRSIPGARRLPVLGHIVHIATSGDFENFLVQQRKVHKRFFQDRATWNAGLTFIKGAKWRAARKAFESALIHPKSLQAQAPYVAQCADGMCALVQRHAGSGEPVDVLPLVYAMTLDAVGFAAFGLDLGGTSTLGAEGRQSGEAPAWDAAPPPDGWWEDHPPGSPEFARCLVRCAVGVMRGTAIASASIYTALVLIFPYLEPVARLMSRVLPDRAMALERRYFRGVREACKVILRVWRERKASSGVSEQGFLARLVSETSEEDRLSDVEVIGNAVAFVVTGYDSTGSTVASALYFLSRNPEAQRKLQEEVDQVLGGKAATQEDLERMPYLNAVFMETLRLKSPGTGAVRETDAPFDLGNGVVVPKGTPLFISLSACQQDAASWGPSTEAFAPERHLQPGHEELAPTNPAAMMPFGAGARQCVGYKLAQLMGRMALARLVQRFTFSPGPGAPEPKWSTSLGYVPDRIVVRVDCRSP